MSDGGLPLSFPVVFGFDRCRTCTEASESRAQTCNCSNSVTPVPSQAPELQYHSQPCLRSSSTEAFYQSAYFSGHCSAMFQHAGGIQLLPPHSTFVPASFGQPQLTLYLRAIRGESRRYISLQLPVDLKLETSKRTAEVSTRVDDVKDEQPPRKRLKVDSTSEKLLKDGFYFHPLMTMDVETRGDGRQRVLLTSVTDELDSVSLAEAWLAPAEEYPTTGCLELRGALPTARICPHGDNE
ncbi:hypothetical protein FOZ63_020079, partial [Perkinsus olseni]